MHATCRGRLIFANRTFCEMVGYSMDELMGGRADAFLANAGPRVHGSGRTHRVGVEAHWTHRSGKPLDVMVFESPLVDGRGRQVGWMGSIVDVTERKRLEELERRQREVHTPCTAIHLGRSGLDAGARALTNL